MIDANAYDVLEDVHFANGLTFTLTRDRSDARYVAFYGPMQIASARLQGQLLEMLTHDYAAPTGKQELRQYLETARTKARDRIERELALVQDASDALALLGPEAEDPL